MTTFAIPVSELSVMGKMIKVYLVEATGAEKARKQLKRHLKRRRCQELGIWLAIETELVPTEKKAA